MRTIKFYTLGCKVNQYESQALREHFAKKGFKEIDRGRADLYLINTCTVTKRADSRSLNLIRRARRESPKAEIIVAGCLAESDSDKIRDADIAARIIREKEKESLIKKGISYFKGHTRAFLKAQDGCDNACAYCKVPLVRGRSRSRSLNDIVKEARRLVEAGYKEIVLTGICLGSYGKDLKPKEGLVSIINALEKIEDLLRLRLSSVEAKDVSGALIEKMARSSKLCRHLHIPIQSGDNLLLKRMNRRYSSRSYLELIYKIRRSIPKIAFTTDVIVGLPGEDKKAFQNTINLIKEILPLRVHIFPYSERKISNMTVARKDALEVKRRLLELKKVAEQCRRVFIKKCLNKPVDVLFEQRVKNSPDLWEGYTDNYIKIRIESDEDLRGKIIQVAPADFLFSA